MTVKQFFITRNSRLQCSNLFKAYSLNTRLFARNRAYIERISMHFVTSFIWQTRTATAFWFIFSILHTLEDNIDNDSFRSNALSV